MHLDKSSTGGQTYLELELLHLCLEGSHVRHGDVGSEMTANTRVYMKRV